MSKHFSVLQITQTLLSFYFIVFLLKRINHFNKNYLYLMNSVMKKFQLAEKRYKKKIKKDKKEIGLNAKKIKKQKNKVRIIKEEGYKNYNNQLQKTEKTTKVQNYKQYERNKRRYLIRNKMNQIWKWNKEKENKKEKT